MDAKALELELGVLASGWLGAVREVAPSCWPSCWGTTKTTYGVLNWENACCCWAESMAAVMRFATNVPDLWAAAFMVWVLAVFSADCQNGVVPRTEKAGFPCASLGLRSKVSTSIASARAAVT
eukprot:2979598-Prymnesium_polylepis.1